MAVSPDGRHVVSGSDDRTVAVWDLGHRGAAPRCSPATKMGDFRGGEPATAGHVVSGSRDDTVAVWDLDTGERLRELTGHRAR